MYSYNNTWHVSVSELVISTHHNKVLPLSNAAQTCLKMTSYCICYTAYCVNFITKMFFFCFRPSKLSQFAVKRIAHAAFKYWFYKSFLVNLSIITVLWNKILLWVVWSVQDTLLNAQWLEKHRTLLRLATPRLVNTFLAGRMIDLVFLFSLHDFPLL